MKYKKGDKIKVKIKKLAFGGAGIGKIRDYVIFVDDALPGDTVEAELTKVKANFAEARTSKITKKSPKRIRKKCPHFGTCGGCLFQNLPYKDQLKIKESQVKEALMHIGGFDDPKVNKIIGCKDEWYYRNKMEFSFDTDEKGKVNVGLHPKRRRYDVFSLEKCMLMSEDIGELVQEVQKFINKNKLKTYNFRENKGLLRAIAVRDSKRNNERMVNLITSDEPFKAVDKFVKMLTTSKKFASPTSIYHTKQAIKKGKQTKFIEKKIFGDKFITETLEIDKDIKLDFEIFPRAFFQPNTNQAEVLYKTAFELGNIKKANHIYDLFCGTGTLALIASTKAKKVTGIEINKSAVENAVENAKKNKIENVEFIIGDAYKEMKKLDHTPDVVIVDPPRSGLGKKLTEHICEIKPKKLIYISCNPTTLARDVKIFAENGYKLKVAQPVDMFPHTYHIETVSVLSI